MQHLFRSTRCFLVSWGCTKVPVDFSAANSADWALCTVSFYIFCIQSWRFFFQINLGLFQQQLSVSSLGTLLADTLHLVRRCAGSRQRTGCWPAAPTALQTLLGSNAAASWLHPGLGHTCLAASASLLEMADQLRTVETTSQSLRRTGTSIVLIRFRQFQVLQQAEQAALLDPA